MKILHDHAHHLGKEFVNARYFVTLAVTFPMRDPDEPRSVQYFMVPFACRIYQPEGDSNIKIVGQQHGIFECDSWYPKKEVLNFVK